MTRCSFYKPSVNGTSFRQGEIISTPYQIAHAADKEDWSDTENRKITYDYALILSQDCDLDWDHNSRPELLKHFQRDPQLPEDKVKDLKSRIMRGVLFAQTFNAESFREKSGLNSGLWKAVKLLNNPRYQLIQSVDRTEDALGEGVPALALDFKNAFTIPMESLIIQVANGTAKRRCFMESPYFEQLSTRFASYHFRVGTPQPHFLD